MNKVELLSPAGNTEMLKYAIMYGADAVYLAGTRFGARKFAANFSDEELVNAIKFAHLYGVKVYVTINTLIKMKEVTEFLDYVKFIYENGVDAVLVQDFGMLNLIRKVIPNLEVHASTQMHNNGKNMINLLKKCGVKRVVLDREMSLSEINELPKGIEKEIFCHGALCVSYSGQCLLSSLIMNRSGNRGECAGLCRLSYHTKCSDLNKYYLSLKDICTINHLDKILSSPHVDSLKIEGRMKSPMYVGYMTYIYRKQIDAYYNGVFRNISKQEMDNIMLLFNRGFTKGFLLGASNEEVVNRDSPNHIGIPIGQYEEVKNKIKLTLTEELCQGDAIRFSEAKEGMTVNFLYDKKDNLISLAQKGDVVFIDNFLKIHGTGELRKVASIKLKKEVDELPKRTIGIEGEIELLAGRKAVMRISDGLNKLVLEGAVVEKSINRPISLEEVKRQICKTGNTIYKFEKLEIKMDENVFINLKDLNTLRRDILAKLDEARIFRDRRCKYFDASLEMQKVEQSDVNISVVVENKEQVEIASKYKCEVFSSNMDLVNGNTVNVKVGENPVKINSNKYIISDLGALELIKNGDIVHSDYMLNVVNSYTVCELSYRGVNKIGVSVECNYDEIEDICSRVDTSLLEILVYGRVELMKMKFNPTINDGNNLLDRNNAEYIVKKTDKMNYLLSPDPLNKIDEIKDLIALGIKNFRLDFYDESAEEMDNILKSISTISET